MDKHRFIKDLQKHAKSLAKYKLNLDIDNIKNTLIAGQQHIEENEQSVTLINNLIPLTTRDITERDVEVILPIISEYWMTLLQSAQYKIFFYGTHSHYLSFSTIIADRFQSQLVHIDITADVELCIQTINHPSTYDATNILIYDDEGSHILRRKFDCANVFSYIYYSPLRVDCGTNKKYAMYLEYEYNKYNTQIIDNVVTGSSYAWWGVPTQLTTCTANMSVKSGDTAFALAITEHLAQSGQLKNHIHITSFFDLHHELARSKSTFNSGVFKELKFFAKKNNIPYIQYDEEIFTSNHDEIYQPASISSSIEKNLLNLFISEAKLIAAITDIVNQKYHNFDFHTLIGEQKNESSMCEEEMDKLSIQRGTNHSKLFRYKESLKSNSRNLEKMVHNTEINKYAMYIVFAPQPQKYIENIDKEMLNEAFSFYQQITFNKKNIVLIDMSSDPDFTRHDFQDGDHLNFKGAIKFIQKLQAYGITI